jgi:hypothetical protein
MNEIRSKQVGVLKDGSINMVTRRRFLQHAATAAALALPMASRRRAGADETRPLPPFGEPTLISGSARDRGRQYGKHFNPGIREFLDREIYRAFEGKPNLKRDLLRYAAACFRAIRSECPIIADELEGMAEGTGLRLEDHVLITLHEELYHRGVLPPVSHCTAVAVGPPETERRTWVGQTWDWMPTVAGMSTLLEWRRDDGPSLLAYAFPGLWVGAAVNSAGLALCWTSADLGKPGQTPRVGLPAYVLLAHLMYQPTLDAAIEAAQRNQHAGWFTFVLGDGSGRLLNVEGSPGQIEIEEIAGRLVRVGFGTRRMSGTPAGPAVARHPRCVSMDVLLDQTKGRTDVETLKTNFSDPARGICVGASTIDLMIFDATTKSAHVSRGPAYGVAWNEHRFRE